MEIDSKSTWNTRVGLKKSEIKRLYDALCDSHDRKAYMQHMIHFPPKYKTVFANLMKSVTRTFDQNECVATNYKSECYKQFRDILNAFYESISDSGEAVRFTVTTPNNRSPIPMPSKRSPTPKRARSPVTCMMPPPLPPSAQNRISNLPDWKIKIFVNVFLMCTGPDQRKQFAQRYLYAVNNKEESFPAFVDDIEIDMNHIASEFELNTTLESLVEHLKYTDSTNRDNRICILYPFPNIHGPRRNSLHNLGGNRRRRTKKSRK